MSRRPLILCACVFAVLAALAFRPTRPVPAIVLDLRAMPEVVRATWTGPVDAHLTVVHLHDWPFIPRDRCNWEGLDFKYVCESAGAVQQAEVAIARRLIKAHGITAIYSEGLSEETRSDLQLRLDVLKELQDGQALARAGLADELQLEVGAPGRLWLAGDVREILPLEDRQALADAKPFEAEDGTLVIDPAKLAARHRAMVARLPFEGLALVVLGASHDLEEYLPRGVLYVRVWPR